LKYKISKRNGIIAVTVIVIALIILSSFLFLNSQTSNTQLEKLSIGIGLQTPYQSALIYIAQNRGYFTHHGLNVSLQNFAGGIDALNGLINKNVDISLSSEYLMVGTIFLEKSNVSIVAVTDQFLGIDLVCRRDTGIENVSDLDGKRIGLSVGTVAEFYLGRFFDLYGGNIENVTLVNSPASQVTPQMLTNGTVDAVIAQDFQLDSFKEQLGDNMVTFQVQVGQPTFWGVNARNEWIANHPQTITKLLKALQEAEIYVVSNPNEAKGLLQTQINYTDAQLSTVWPDNYYSLSLNQALVIAMRDEAQWMINHNLTNQTQVPNFTDNIYTDGLKAVKPDAVSIIK
jgi:NitT/TauT family transport system substrate-binding protein